MPFFPLKFKKPFVGKTPPEMTRRETCGTFEISLTNGTCFLSETQKSVIQRCNRTPLESQVLMSSFASQALYTSHELPVLFKLINVLILQLNV